uniref:Sidoreflexin n=1 Tax=Rhabditophanes sp. KR3021 TaxID=114890 RepID=A0AC35TH67_9BILA
MPSIFGEPSQLNNQLDDDLLLGDLQKKPDIYRPRWNQDTFPGRLRHFAAIVNPLNLFVSNSELDRCKAIVLNYEEGNFDPNMKLKQLWDAKHIYDSAYHVTSGEKMPVMGRMCSQVPVNSMISAGMLLSYHSTKAMLFWQWANQSYNSLVNFSNRAGEEHLSKQRLLSCYFAAASGSMAAASGLKYYVDRMKIPTVIRRLVPFGAVGLANCINIPMMRSAEFVNGIPIKDEHGHTLANSTKVANYAIPMVVLCRILMNLPDMVFLPILINQIVKIPAVSANKFLRYGIKITLAGLCVCAATPISCAIFPQMTAISVDNLEPSIQDKIKKLPNPPVTVFYNKGL